MRQRFKISTVFYHLICPHFDRPFRKKRDILKMIIECISIYMTSVYNILHRDFIIWFFFQQLPEGIYNCKLCSIHIDLPAFSYILYIIQEILLAHNRIGAPLLIFGFFCKKPSHVLDASMIYRYNSLINRFVFFK